jgi:hypothetical protein
MAVSLRIQGGRRDTVEPSQQAAFQEFQSEKDRLITEAEHRLLRYYQEVAPTYRDMFDQASAAERLPGVSAIEDLHHVLTLRYLYLPWNFSETEHAVGLVFDCTWDPGHGIAVKIVNGRVVEVGPQDIVL